MTDSINIGILQLKCTADKAKNFNTCKKMITEASDCGAKVVFLPENFDFVSENKQQMLDLCESLDGDLISRYCSLAREKGIYLSLGGFHRQDDSIKGKVFNSHVMIDNVGVISAVYDKLHLFDVDIPNVSNLKESNMVEPGRGVVPPVKTPIGLLGLAICYDLRFPAISQSLREMCADVLTYPSAFNATTGKAHWHTLLRARAIENQCFVIAAAQEGQHNDKRSSYGHSIAIDPWGKVITERTEPGEGLLLCTIDSSLVAKYRTEMPVFLHRRLDLFPSPWQQGLAVDIGTHPYMFGPHKIEPSCVFYRSVLTYAFVNVSPLVPGHVLVSPLRGVARFVDLTPIEVTDIYAVVKRIAPKLAAHFSAHSLTISQQDGVDAGQTVDHVHVHILPRKPGDFPDNDDIYKHLQDHDKPGNKERKFRPEEQMAKEGMEFRKLFYC